jgi:hypothetical protein
MCPNHPGKVIAMTSAYESVPTEDRAAVTEPRPGSKADAAGSGTGSRRVAELVKQAVK